MAYREVTRVEQSLAAPRHTSVGPDRVLCVRYAAPGWEGPQGEPLTQRRARLPEIVGENATVRLSQELPGSAVEIVKAVRGAGLKGVVAKRTDSMYQPGERSTDWVKLKLERQQEFVIGGNRAAGASGVDALLIWLTIPMIRLPWVPHICNRCG
jgi:ATP dependent DNA ligase domain